MSEQELVVELAKDLYTTKKALEGAESTSAQAFKWYQETKTLCDAAEATVARLTQELKTKNKK